MENPQSQPAEPSRVVIAPQPGPQEMFLSTPADIAIYGGAAGGGKSFALLLEPLRHYHNGKFGCVIFRRNATQVRNEGGLWDESMALYGRLQGRAREAFLEWEFPSGMRVKFAHLEHEKSVYDWQGAQIALIQFDELTHFTEHQFWYMVSRNRSMSGVPGYIRASTNPDVNSWVRTLIAWWIDKDTGYPIKERAGKLRWFIRQNNEMIWADTREELIAKYGADELPKSLTFVPSSVHDNKILLKTDPSYLANLKALPRVERLRLEGGNWNVRPTAGMYFNRDWFEIIDVMPTNILKVVRYWDKAATEPNENNKDPDWTAGVKMAKLSDGTFVVADVKRDRKSPMGVQRLIKNTASQERNVEICLEQDPGQAGVAEAQASVRDLMGYIVHVRKPTGDKATRAKPYSAACENGTVKILRAEWNEDYLSELENFTGEDNGGHDDQVDASSGAFNELCSDVSVFDVL